MQEVYKDGNLGEIKKFSIEGLKSALVDNNIDHVRVFNKEFGNQVGIPQIEEAVIERIIDKKLDERENRKRLAEDFLKLTAEFDNKKHQ